jgi:hypothetical protein
MFDENFCAACDPGSCDVAVQPKRGLDNSSGGATSIKKPKGEEWEGVESAGPHGSESLGEQVGSLDNLGDGVAEGGKGTVSRVLQG